MFIFTAKYFDVLSRNYTQRKMEPPLLDLWSFYDKLSRI